MRIYNQQRSALKQCMLESQEQTATSVIEKVCHRVVTPMLDNNCTVATHKELLRNGSTHVYRSVDNTSKTWRRFTAPLCLLLMTVLTLITTQVQATADPLGMNYDYIRHILLPPPRPQCFATNSPHAKYKVAVVFYGLSRNLSSTHPYNRKHLLDVLTSNSIAYDVFWHTLTANEISHVRARENKVPLDKYDVRDVSPCVVELSDNSFVRDSEFDLFCKARKLDPVAAVKKCTEKYPFEDNGAGNSTKSKSKSRFKDCMAGYFDVYRDSYESLKNLLGAFHTLSRLGHVVEHYSKKRNVTYDSIVVLRPDTAMVGVPLDLPAVIEKIQSNELRGVWTPDYMEMSGYNDRFAYGSYHDMLSYMHRGDHYRDTPLPPSVINAEMFLKFYLEFRKIPRHVTSVKVVRVRANGRVDPKDCALFLGKTKQCKNCFAYSDYSNLQYKSKYKECISATCGLNGPARC